MILTLPSFLTYNNDTNNNNIIKASAIQNFETNSSKGKKSEKMITIRRTEGNKMSHLSSSPSVSSNSSSSSNFHDLTLPHLNEKDQILTSESETSSSVTKSHYQNHQSQKDKEETFDHNQPQSPVWKRRSSWGMGTMMLLFLLSVILSSSTSTVMCSPHGGRVGNSRNQLIDRLTSSTSSSSIPHLQNDQEVLEPMGQEQQLSRASQSSGDDEGGAVAIEDLGSSGGMHHRYMIQPQRQLYLPSLLKSSEPGGVGIKSLAGQKEQEQQGDGGDAPDDDDDDVSSINGFYPRQRQGQEDDGGDDHPDYHHTMSYIPSNPTGQFHQQNQNLQNEDESNQAGGWETVIDPHLYLLTEWNSNAIQQRMRRNVGPSLSIVNPLDVLRQRLLLEIARRKMRQSHNQIIANAEMLKNIGRRRRR